MGDLSGSPTLFTYKLTLSTNHVLATVTFDLFFFAGDFFLPDGSTFRVSLLPFINNEPYNTTSNYLLQEQLPILFKIFSKRICCEQPIAPAPLLNTGYGVAGQAPQANYQSETVFTLSVSIFPERYSFLSDLELEWIVVLLEIMTLNAIN